MPERLPQMVIPRMVTLMVVCIWKWVELCQHSSLLVCKIISFQHCITIGGKNRLLPIINVIGGK
jgi:hypothetical protein